MQITTRNSSHEPTNISRFSFPLLLCRQCYFILILDVHLWPGKQAYETVVLSDPTPGEGKKDFLEVFYVTARSLLQIRHHGLSISSPGVHRPLLSATRCRPDWAASFQIYSCWRRGIILHSFFSNHVFHTEYDDLDKYYFAKQFIKMFNLHYYDRFI
jgi:hypothetical protein